MLMCKNLTPLKKQPKSKHNKIDISQEMMQAKVRFELTNAWVNELFLKKVLGKIQREWKNRSS